METNRLVSSLCYFSIFFAGFIFPICVYFIVDSPEVKEHAKKALLSHLVPIFTVAFFAILLIVTGGEPTLAGGIFTFILVAAINVWVLIWNIIKGVKVLVK